MMKPVLLASTTWATETIQANAPVPGQLHIFARSVELNNWGSDRLGLELDPIS